MEASHFNETLAYTDNKAKSMLILLMQILVLIILNLRYLKPKQKTA